MRLAAIGEPSVCMRTTSSNEDSGTKKEEEKKKENKNKNKKLETKLSTTPLTSRGHSQTTHVILLTDYVSLLQKVKSGMGNPD